MIAVILVIVVGSIRLVGKMQPDLCTGFGVVEVCEKKNHLETLKMLL